MNTNDRNQQYLLECLLKSRLPTGGMAFTGLWKIRPDFTPVSLTLLSSLLRHIHQNAGTDYDTLAQSHEGRNFLRTVAAYLAEYVARHSGASYSWDEEGGARFGRWTFRPLAMVKARLEGDERPVALDGALWQAFRMSDDADCGRMSAFALECYAQRRNLPGGLAYGEDLAALELPGGEGSLKNIDELVILIRERENIGEDNYTRHFSGVEAGNFLYLLAFFAVRALGETQNAAPEWFNRSQLARMGGRRIRAEGLEDSMFARIARRPVPVFHLLRDAFCGGLSLADWAQHGFQAAQPTVSGEIVPDDPNRLARQLFDIVLEGAPRDGSRLPDPAYLDALRSVVRPDYSLRSLVQLDKLLAEIHAGGPDMDEFLARPDNQAFVYFCACYLARTAAELSANTLKLLTYQEAQVQLPELPSEWYTRLCAQIGSGVFFPLGRIIEQLFYPASPTGCVNFAKELQRNHRGTVSIRTALAEPSEAVLPDLWRKPLLQAGFAAAFALHERLPLAGAGSLKLLTPALFTPAGIQWRMSRLSAGSVQESVQNGYRQLQDNPQQLPHQVLSFEGHANLPRGRFHAVMVEVRSYRGRTLNLSAVVPFIADENGRPFIGSLAVSSTDFRTPGEAVAAADVIYKGMDDFQAPELGKRWWRGFYRKNL